MPAQTRQVIYIRQLSLDTFRQINDTDPMRIVTTTPDRLDDLSDISIAFEVTAELSFSVAPDGDYSSFEQPVDSPYLKDYDAIRGNHPKDWATQFDLRNWGLLLAEKADAIVGACLIAWNTPGVDMLEGRTDLAVLWDIRVDPARRGQGIGTALFRAALVWAKEHGATELKVETQNNNVQAVRFYTKQGCRLVKVIPGAYPDFPNETMLLFHILLDQPEYQHKEYPCDYNE